MTNTATLTCLFFRVNILRSIAAIQLLLLLSGELPVVLPLVRYFCLLNLLERRQAIRIGCVALQETGFGLVRFCIFEEGLELREM